MRVSNQYDDDQFHPYTAEIRWSRFISANDPLEQLRGQRRVIARRVLGNGEVDESVVTTGDADFGRRSVCARAHR